MRKTIKPASMCRKAQASLAAAIVGGALLMALAGAVQAQGVIDPTRPPQMVETPAAEGNAGNGLQSVFISDTRRAAIIGGQLVELGHKYGDATLVSVADDEVTLERGREKQVLRLFPGIDKKMLTVAPAAKAPVAARRKSKSRGIK
jgi:MSHA biogenesis protein MshK